MLSKEAECLTDTRLEMKARPLTFKVSVPCPLLKFCGKSAQLIYTHTHIIYSRHVIALESGLSNRSPSVIFPWSGSEMCPSEATR